MDPCWYWQTDTAYPHLRTTLLGAWPHGFFTRAAWPQGPEHLNACLDVTAMVYRARQVHGNRILSPSDFQALPASPEPLPAADAILTGAAHQAAWVCTADCVPALIADVATGQVAAVHAGWRGTALKILPLTLEKMQQQGSQPATLRVALGPAIAGAVYQVSTAVAATVGRSLMASAADDDTVLAYLSHLQPSPLLPDPQPGRVRLDVRQVNVWQLKQWGLADDHVAIAPHCTYQDAEHFFSYRRSREKKVQWSGIVSGHH